MTDMTVANTIRDQIGRKACYMMGAKNFVGSATGLTFKIGRNAGKVTHITITVTPEDTYDIEFVACRGVNVRTIKEVKGYYVDMMHAVISETTGMALSI